MNNVIMAEYFNKVSYKWLSRNFSLSSNDAKRLLQEFVEKHGSELEVIYALSGWLKDNSQVYQISLVSGPKLAEVKCRFENGCSIQVYSVQACIPNDPAALWNAEFAQAEELFDQPSSVKNCLRDNRFCGVSNSFVKHHATGESGVAPELPKIGVTASSKTNGAALQVSLVPQAQERQQQKPSPKLGHQASTMASTDNKIGKNAPEVHAQAGKPNADKVTAVPAIKKKGQNEKSSSGAGGSLANLWGRATAKSKSSVPSAEAATVIPNPIVNAEAQICAQEALDTASSDDDGQLICKRESNGEGTRKRRVVFNDSDDEDDYENIVNLASPDVPKRQPILDLKPEVGNSDVEKDNLNVVKNEENLEIKKENASKSDSGLLLEDSKAASKSKITKTTSPEKIQSHSLAGLDHTHKRDKASDAETTSPKRKKVLKTYIDERGREVTEVVWEGQTADNKNTEKKAIANVVENRPQAASRPPAFGSAVQSKQTGIVGSKKPARSSGKDLKRGTILSFFKKG